MKAITTADFAAFDWEALTVSYRRRLPHLTLPGAIYFVTFRLDDSVPLEVSRRWSEERSAWIALNPPPWTEAIEKEFHRRFTMRMERYLDAGHGSCLLRNPAARQEVLRSLNHDDGHLYELGDLVIMPNHVHVLIKPLVPEPLSKLLGPAKGASSHKIHQMTGTSGRLWMAESFDHIVRGLDSLRKFQRYIANNPGKAGLSSADHAYEQRWEIRKR